VVAARGATDQRRELALLAVTPLGRGRVAARAVALAGDVPRGTFRTAASVGLLVVDEDWLKEEATPPGVV
jgi:hypothetical protein